MCDYRQQQEVEEEERFFYLYNNDERYDTMKFKDSGADFEEPPVGTHIARCVKVIDLGTRESEYKGATHHKHECLIGWELPFTKMSEGDFEGQPFTVTKFYTASLNEKANLRKDLMNWRGRDFTEQELEGFESGNILGKCCMLSLTMNDKKKVKVTSVIALPKGTQVPPQINPSVLFSLEPDEFDQSVFDALSDGIRGMIEKTPEYQQIKNPQKFSADSGAPFGPNSGNTEGFNDFDDDIPF